MKQLEVNGSTKYNEDTDSLDVYYTDGELAGSIYCGFQYPVGTEVEFEAIDIKGKLHKERLINEDGLMKYASGGMVDYTGPRRI